MTYILIYELYICYIQYMVINAFKKLLAHAPIRNTLVSVKIEKDGKLQFCLKNFYQRIFPENDFVKTKHSNMSEKGDMYEKFRIH